MKHSFIPDDMTFEQEPKDTATEAPPPDAHEPAKYGHCCQNG